MPGYIDITYVKLGTLRPEDIDDVEIQYPGFVQGLIDDETAYIDSRLHKRYAVPFGDPVPIAAKRWCRDLVLPRILSRRGTNPADNDLKDELEKARDLAIIELKEAADSQNGLFELPLRQDRPGDTGLSAPTPLSYSEASPYEFLDAQAEAIRNK